MKMKIIGWAVAVLDFIFAAINLMHFLSSDNLYSYVAFLVGFVSGLVLVYVLLDSK